MSISIDDCEESQVPALQAFFARTYRPDYPFATDRTLFQWQFRDTPCTDGTVWHVKIAQLSGEIVGCLGYIPLEISVAGRIVQGAWVVNWMVDPQQRRLGLGPLMMREVARRFDVTLNIGPNADAREVLSRMGWSNAGELPRYVKVLNINLASKLMEGPSIDYPAQFVVPENSSAGRDSATVTSVRRFDARATALWDGISGDVRGGMTGTRRSADFLNWRYADHPAFRYRLFIQEGEGALTGLAIYRIEVAHGLSVPVARLVEYMDARDSRTPYSPLLAVVLADAEAAGVAVMDFFCAAKGMGRAMAAHGFVDARHPVTAQIPVLFQPIDRRRTGIALMTRLGPSCKEAPSMQWYVTKGDGDQDRPN